MCRKPRNITRPGAIAEGNPHPDQTAAKAKGVDVALVLQYTRTGLSGSTYMVRVPSLLTCVGWAISIAALQLGYAAI